MIARTIWIDSARSWNAEWRDDLEWGVMAEQDQAQDAARRLKTSLLDALEEFFDSYLDRSDPAPGSALTEQRLRLAAAVLMIEIVRADFEIREDERRALRESLRRAFDLSDEATRELVIQAQAQVERPPRLHEYAAYVDRRCRPEQKRRIIKALWQVAFADAEILAHEEYLVRKIAELLHVSREEFVAAQLEARAEFR
jgi:uncharacterized tellurite resistance protein B-like protein